jgi:tetratricopeptide (TPR) repeat protein
MPLPILRLTFNSKGMCSPGRACEILCLLLFVSWPAISQSSAGQATQYARAETLVRDHQWDEGISLLEQLLKREPDNLKALNLKGLALIGKGDTHEADQCFSKALEIDPRFVPALKNLAMSEFNSQNYAAAETHLNLAESITPQDQTIHLYLGEIFYRQKTYQRAVDQFAKVDQLAVHAPTAGAHEAICYLHLKDVSRSAEVLDLIPTDRLNAPAQFDLALALEDSGLPARAVPLIDSVYSQFPDSYDIAVDRLIIELDAKNLLQAIEGGKKLQLQGHDTAEVENLLAEAYADNSQFQLAFDAYRRAINLAPQDEQNYIDLASLCLSQRSFDAGLKVVDVALLSHPGSERLLFMRGLIHATDGDFEAAEVDFKLSEKGSSQKDLGAIGLGASYLQKGQYDQAINTLRADLHTRPNDPSLLYLLAQSLIRSGAAPGSPAYAEAQAALEKSVRLDPSLCLPHVALGKIYLDEKRLPESVEQLEKARSIDPTERATYSHLAVAYRRLGQVEKANEEVAVLKAMSEQDRIAETARMKTASRKEAPQPGMTSPPQ